MPLSTAVRFGFAGAAFVLLGGAGFLGWRLSQTRAERDALRTQMLAVQERAEAADREAASLRLRLEQATRVAGNPITIPQVPTFRSGSAPATVTGARFEPTISRLGHVTDYREVHRKLGLTEAQGLEFDSLVRMHRGRRDFADESTELMVRQAIRNRFGERAVAELARADETRRFLPIVQRLAGQLFKTPNPLSAEQQDLLLETLATVTRAPSGVTNFGLLDEKEVAAQAAVYLAPSQIEVMKGVLAPGKYPSRSVDPAPGMRLQQSVP